ncbi:hypothetical protein, partial [Streptomyces europaeiscabiei]|uniref:hypothetical protein n=1 Tax=Streptomyces europaeiscabiei TaxID=146819 RepID=UPI0029B1C226
MAALVRSGVSRPRRAPTRPRRSDPVSYKHTTLPPTRLVENSVFAVVSTKKKKNKDENRREADPEQKIK